MKAHKEFMMSQNSDSSRVQSPRAQEEKPFIERSSRSSRCLFGFVHWVTERCQEFHFCARITTVSTICRTPTLREIGTSSYNHPRNPPPKSIPRLQTSSNRPAKLLLSPKASLAYIPTVTSHHHGSRQAERPKRRAQITQQTS